MFIERLKVLKIIKSLQCKDNLNTTTKLYNEILKMNAADSFSIYKKERNKILKQEIIGIIEEKFKDRFCKNIEEIYKETDFDFIAEQFEKKKNYDWDTLEYVIDEYFVNNSQKFQYVIDDNNFY